MSKLDIYKASAGSGKTFALTLEYFRIIFAVPSEYKNILAVTFTNKATEEMKSRIINELHRLAEGKKSSYGPLLQQEFGFSPDELKNKAAMLRTLLLHDYGRISVTTIDRFFQRIIKSFTKELGIFPGYNVELDSDFILLKAVDKVMEEVKRNTSLRSWIADLMSSNVDEGKSWSIKAKIAELGEELFKENYMLFDNQILDKFNDKNFLKSYRNFLQQVIREYEEELTEISREAISMIRNAGLELRDFRGNKCGCAAHFYKLRERKFDEVTKTAREGIDCMDYWVAKDCDGGIKAKIEGLYPVLNALLKRCILLYDKKCRYYLSACQIAGNLYQLGILNDLYKEVRAYCDEKGVMLLSDTTRILNILIEGNDTSFLFEKTGNYYKHLMIDEFQDTSSLQWRNFRPLVVNTLSEGNEAMIVGDVKQSIYRWRNGDWTLLAKGVESEFRRLGVNKIVLENNWRSAKEIVDFNNIFFGKAASLLKTLYDEHVGEENQWSSAIVAAYDHLEQKAKLDKSGYVDILFGPSKKEEQCDELVMKEVVSVIQDITERGGHQKDIVILVRSGKEGAFVANYLMNYNKTSLKEIRFISNDSLYIWSSPYVKFITAVLRYIVEPYDLVNKASVLYFYNTFVASDTAHPDQFFRAAKEENLFSGLNMDFAVNSGKIMSYSLFETVEAIIDNFGLKEKREEVPYLIAFQDIIFEYEAGNSNSILLFLEWWEKEQTKRVLTTSENVDAVRILTIHKSKGLEFEYVILPFCSWELDNVRPLRRIWCHNCEEKFSELEYAPLNYSSKLGDTIFKDAYFDEHLKAYVDNLNLLYVALTRAKKELYVRPYMPKINKNGSPALTDMGAFIYWVIKNLKGEPACHFTADKDMNIRYGERNITAVADGISQALTLDAYPVYNMEDRISIKYNYKDYTDVNPQKLSAIDEGKLLHEIFKSIEYVEDVEQSVRNAYLAGMISKKEKEKYCTEIRDYLSDERVADWFGRKYDVINERDILFRFGSRVRPDRVLVKGKLAIVVDYKFGQKEENKYLKQIQFYRTTLKQMGYKEVKGYIWYVKLRKIVCI